MVALLETDIYPRFQSWRKRAKMSTRNSVSSNSSVSTFFKAVNDKFNNRRSSLSAINAQSYCEDSPRVTITCQKISNPHSIPISNSNQTVRTFVQSLLMSQNLQFNESVVVIHNDNEINLDDSIKKYLNQHLRIESNIIFRLVLPNKKVIGLKVSAFKTIKVVLIHILTNQGYRFSSFSYVNNSTNEKININDICSAFDGEVLRMEIKKNIFYSKSIVY